MPSPVPPGVPSLVVDAADFWTVEYHDDRILLRHTSGDLQVVEFTSTDRTGPPPHRHLLHEVEYTAADLVDTAGRLGVTLA